MDVKVVVDLLVQDHVVAVAMEIVILLVKAHVMVLVIVDVALNVKINKFKIEDYE